MLRSSRRLLGDIKFNGDNDRFVGDLEVVGDLVVVVVVVSDSPEAIFFTFLLRRFDEESDDVSLTLLVFFNLLFGVDSPSSSLRLRVTLPLVLLASTSPLLLR